ncbi:MAG: SHD1 domain-containing protein [Pirellulales bacterium]
MHQYLRPLRLSEFAIVLIIALVPYDVPATLGQKVEARTWRDASGIFSVQAELFEMQPVIVKLRSADGMIIEVRRDKLSQQDRGYLADFENANNPFKIVDPEAKVTTAESKSTTTPIKSQQLPSILPALDNVMLFSQVQPLKELKSTHTPLANIPPGEAYVDNVQFGSRLSPILLIDRDQKKVAISVSPPIYNSRSKQSSRVYLGNLPNGPFKRMVDSVEPLHLLDYCSESDQTLATGSKAGETADRELILYEGLSSGELREVSRYILPIVEEKVSRVNSARLIGKNRAIVVVDGCAHCWDFSSGKQLFQTSPSRPHRGFGEITFSDDGRLMIVPSAEGLHFVGTESGEDLGYLPLGNTYALRLVFDPRANRIAYCDRDCWGMYDYSTLKHTSPQTTTLALSSKIFGWIAPNLILAGEGVVLDDQQRIPVWRYHAKWENSRIWENSITLVDEGDGLKLRTLEFPDSDLRAALINSPKIEQWLATDSGTHVKLQLELPETLPENVNADDLREQLKRLATTAGWIADDSVSLSLVMSISPGKKFKDLYQQYVAGSPNSEKVEVEITPMISRLEVREGENVIWSMQSQNDQPNRYGQSPYSKEEYIKQRERALPDFFSGIQVPSRIPRTPYTYGLGSKYARNILWQDDPRAPRISEQSNRVSAASKAEAVERTGLNSGVSFSISHKRPADGLPQKLRTSPDGKLTIAILDHAKACVVDAADMAYIGQPFDILPANRTRNVSEQWAFSPDGRYVAISQSASNAGGEDTEGNIGVWEVTTGKLIAKATPTTHNHLGAVLQMAFSTDGRTVVVHCKEISGK